MNPKLFNEINSGKPFLSGQYGLPEYYPAPEDTDNLLFYIQRSQNLNTVIYEVNTCLDGRINESCPIRVYWVRYSENGEIQDLNYIQNKLAYGYEAKMISGNAFEFELVSYRSLKFFVDKDGSGSFRAHTRIRNRLCSVSNIYVYVEDLGLFPDVKFIEIYGQDVENQFYVYEKIYI